MSIRRNAAQGNIDAVAVLGTDLTTSFAAMFTDLSQITELIIISTCNQDIVISLDGGVTDSIYVPAQVIATAVNINFGANGTIYSGDISVREASTNVTSGTVAVSVIRAAL